MRARAALALIIAVASLAPAVARADEPAAQQTDARDRSRAAFVRGVAQLRAQDWAGARASFEEAWALYQHPSILLNLGVARLKTGDPVLAEQDLVRFLSDDGGASADEIAGAREALADARAQIGTLRVVVRPSSARVALDGKLVEVVRPEDAGAGPPGMVAEVRAKAGSHELVVTAQGYAGNERSVTVPAKGEAEVRVALTPLDAPPAKGTSTRQIVGWSLAGLGGAALVAGGAFALRAKSLSEDYADRANPGFQDPGVRSEGIAFRTGADVALGVALLSGAAAAVLLLTDLGSPPSSGVTAAAIRAGRAPALLRW